MNRILISIAGLILLLVLAVLVGPGLIDWNVYKGDITSLAKKATGRNLFIDGTIEVSVLPAPALLVNKVRLANMEGASGAEMVRLEKLEVRVALAPLLGGRVEVEQLRLIRPVIELERLADGRANWEFPKTGAAPAGDAAAEPADGGGQGTGAGGGGAPAADFRLDNFVVMDGTLIYRDGAAGTVERVEGINATIAVGSLDGPFESSGSLSVRAMPVTYDLSVGRIIEGRTAPMTLTVGVVPGGTEAVLSGVVVGLDDKQGFKGKATIKGDKLSGLLQAVAGPDPLPGLLAQRFRVDGEINASAGGMEAPELNIALGAVEARGGIALEITDTITAAVTIAATNIDVDKWLAMASDGAAPAPAPAPAATQKPSGAGTNSVVLSPAPAAAIGFQLPSAINASLDLTVQSMTVKGGLVRQLRVNSEMTGGEITLSQFSAQFPGSTDVALFGFLVPDKGQPKFDGELELAIGDLHGVFNWLGISPPPVPNDRLRKLTLSGKVKANPSAASLGNIDMQFDSSRLTGMIKAGLGGRPKIAADLTLDRINIDAYLMADGAAPAAAPAPAPAAAPAREEPGTSADPFSGVIAAFKAIAGIDADVKTRITTVVYKGSQIKDVALDAALVDSVLELRQASVGKMAGTSIAASGTINGASTIPSLDNFKIAAKADDLARLFALAGRPLPMDSGKLGSVTFDGRIDGTILKPKVNLKLTGAGAGIAADGTVSLLPIGGGFDGRIAVNHPDLQALFGALGIAYRPASRLGGLDLKAAVKAEETGLTLSDLSGRAGPVDLAGSLRLALDGPRPRIVADLRTGEIVVDRFMPVGGTAALEPASKIILAAFKAPAAPEALPHLLRMAATAPGRWPSDPINLSALEGFDADLKLNASAIAYGPYRLEGAVAAAGLDAGMARLERLTGGLFGGTLEAAGSASAAPPSKVAGRIVLKGADVAKALGAALGEAPASGRADLTIDVNSAGYSVADMVAGLSGKGAFALHKIEARAKGTGTAMAAVLDLVTGLANLGGVVAGKAPGSKPSDVTGSFVIDKGVARTSDLALTSAMGNGRASGNIDLSRWMIDVGGTVEMSQSFLGAVLNAGQKTALDIPFQVKGKLDAPDVKLDTSKLVGIGLQIPGIDKVLKKTGVGNILEKLVPGLGGAPAPAPAPSGNVPPPPASAPPPPAPAPQQLKPRDLLKGLFKGLGG